MSVSERELERHEEELAAIPAEPTGLDVEGERQFRKARRRIGRHHRGWRAGMPALDTLFDDEAHRARALAGSLCTELEDLLITWGRLRSAAGRPDAEAERFVDRTARQWQERAREFVGPMGWQGAAAEEVYLGFVADLSERARKRGRAALRDRAEQVRAKPGRLTLLLRRLARGPLLALRRFFRPAP